MAKVKNKRNAGLADKVHQKRNADANKKKLNPFEVHINREKLKVLGKKSKHDRGLPGVSRAKAIQKRKETLGTEMKIMHKTNAFIDRRIGERNSQLSAEERMIARFAAERSKQHSKKSIYNLADDEILTHRGQTLEQIEKFDDPRSSDDEDEEKKFGGLDDEFVSEGHFGGGVLSKSESKDGAKSHKDLIEQLIADSKKRKAEKQKEKEQTLDLTEKLDSEWKDLQPVVFKQHKEESIIDKLLNKEDKGLDYDKTMRELRFEKRGTPSDALKSKEKLEEEEKKKIEELEKQRQERMLSQEEKAPKRTQTMKHRSADDLDDNFDLDDNKEFMLAYDKDGKPLVPENVLNDFSVPNARKKFDDGISDTSDEDDDENDENNDTDDGNDEDNEIEHDEAKEGQSLKRPASPESIDSESNEDSKKQKLDDEVLPKKITRVDNNSHNDDIESSNDERTQGLLNENNMSESNDLECDTSSDDEPGIVRDKKISNAESESGKLSDGTLKVDSDDDDDDDDDGDDDDDDDEESMQNDKNSKLDLDDLKETDESEEESEENKEKMGSFFDLKSAVGDNLKELLRGKTPSQQSSAIQKLIKSYDPSLSQNNKELLSTLFAHLLQYIHDLFTDLSEESDVIKSFLIFDKIVPYLYDLVHLNKVSTKKFLVELLKEKHDNFKLSPKKVPDLNTLIFFKLVSILYPTSDFRHPVTTPSLIFMTEILTLSRFRDSISVSRGLFIVSLILEYTCLSKRYVPSALNFLRGLIYLSANTSILNPVQVVPPFRLNRDVKILKLERDCSKMAVDNKMAARDLIASEVDDSFRIRCLSTAAMMLKEFFDNYNDIEAQEAIFEQHIQILGRVDLELYPDRVSHKVTEIVRYMKQCLEVKTYTHMAREKVRPKALRLYEPDIQAVFTGSKSSKMSKEGAERARLQGKYKKEMKGALREIRRDKAYIASVKIRQKIQSDNIRKEKVKQIYKDASIQQGELNKLKRMK
ncbi:nucleolar protein 14 homolog [Danaus plexippus]|uniref:nucleolar protein 14 homolog n=1 Tax=Danaus plexippus TaxID=13037 RepID=UPI002AB25DB0|nr:nucleolar protein 14 homolog [Danaus plexippus]